MHVLQPKHTKLNEKEVEELLTNFNITSRQLSKIRLNDPTLPEGLEIGDIIKIERKAEEGKINFYRVIIK